MTMQTFSIRAPLATHWRTGTCEEAACEAHAHGWLTVVDESTDLGQGQAHYIRHDRTRQHRESRNEQGLTVFEFEPGQTCFREHKVPLHRPELFLVRGGSLTRPTGEVRRHANGADWVDELHTNQQRIADLIEKG